MIGPHEIVLEDERVKLSPLTPAHFNDLLPFSENEPDLWQYSLVSGAGRENLQHYINLACEAKNSGHAYPFIVYDKKYNAYAGSTRYYDLQPYHKTTQLGYTWYGKKFWGTGLNTHCKNLLLTYAFETIDVERVEFRADANNARSIAAMKGIGCTPEGILRSNCSAGNDLRRDSIVLSILKNEWFSNVKEHLTQKMKQS